MLYHYRKQELCKDKVDKAPENLSSDGGQDQKDCIPDIQDRVIDLNMKLDWQLGTPLISCLVCTARRWVFSRRRNLTGAEAMAVQGFAAKHITHGDCRFSNPGLLSLAGNAMSGFVLAAIFTSLFSTATDAMDISLSSRAYSIALEDMSDDQVDVPGGEGSCDECFEGEEEESELEDVSDA